MQCECATLSVERSRFHGLGMTRYLHINCISCKEILFDLQADAEAVVALLFAAANNDIAALRRAFLRGQDMEVVDYDRRTALHVAAAEGHLSCVLFLLDTCRVSAVPLDRWGFTPLEEAQRAGRAPVVEVGT